MYQLDADSIPFPLGGIIVERDAGLFERMGEHEWPKDRHILRRRLRSLALAPVE